MTGGGPLDDNAVVEPTASARRPRSGPSVDAAILDVVGDPERPVRHFPFARDLGHLPGRTGVAAGVYTLTKMVRDGEGFFTAERERFGPVFRAMVGADPIVCVADAALNLEVALNKDGAWSSALPWAYLLGGVNRRWPSVDGALAVDGGFHREARQIMRPAFTTAALDGYLEAARPIFRERFRRWERSGTVPLKAEVRRLLADVSAKIFLGVDDPSEGARLDRATADAWMAPQAILKRSRFSPAWRRAMRGYDDLWNLLRPQVAARRAGRGVDLFSRMCRAEGAEPWLDDDALVRLLISTMMAAFDTTASGVASMAYLLCKHPAWQDRLRAEALSLGTDAPGAERLEGLTETRQAWQESLRRLPVAGQLNRQSLVETRLGGHRIPAGALVIAMTGTTMWDPRYWDDPMRFDPGRFSPERAEHKRHAGAYMPFGMGAHICLGAQIANLESSAFFSGLLSRRRIALAPDYEAGHHYLPFGIVSGRLDVSVKPLGGAASEGVGR